MDQSGSITKNDTSRAFSISNSTRWYSHANEELKAGCLAVYEAEKAQGAELPAIIGTLQEHIELEEERLSRQREETYRPNQEEERIRLQQRVLAGADCGWTQIEKSEAFYCRRNRRASPRGLTLHDVKTATFLSACHPNHPFVRRLDRPSLR